MLYRVWVARAQFDLHHALPSGVGASVSEESKPVGGPFDKLVRRHEERDEVAVHAVPLPGSRAQQGELRVVLKPEVGEGHDVDVGRVAATFTRLLNLGLVAFKPWRLGAKDGVWQILPVEQSRETRSKTILSVAELFRSLGFAPPAAN